MSYAARVWYHNLNFRSRTRLNSTFYHMWGTMVRDFDFQLNRRELRKRMEIEDLDVILNKRSSCFVFKVLYKLEPTNLVRIFLSKS